MGETRTYALQTWQQSPVLVSSEHVELGSTDWKEWKSNKKLTNIIKKNLDINNKTQKQHVTNTNLKTIKHFKM